MNLGVRDSKCSLHCSQSLHECTEILGTKGHMISRKQVSEEEECFCLLENKQPSNWIAWCLIDSDEQGTFIIRCDTWELMRYLYSEL